MASCGLCTLGLMELSAIAIDYIAKTPDGELMFRVSACLRVANAVLSSLSDYHVMASSLLS